MMRLLWVWLCLVSVVVASHTIRLESKIVNGELLPVISVNGRDVMMIEDRGDASRFVSVFDRAETISMMLSSLDQKGLNLSSIRVRRIKSEYFADLNGHRIFTIYPADRISHNLTSYQLAKKWTTAIKDAVDPNVVATSPVVDVMAEQEVVNYRYALLTLVQLSAIIGIQVLCAFIILWYIDRYRVGHYRRLQQQMVQFETRCLDLEKQIESLESPKKVSAVSRNRSRNVSNL